MKTFYVTIARDYAIVRLTYKAHSRDRVWPKVDRDVSRRFPGYLILGCQEAA